MTLRERLDQDLKNAMRAKDMVRLSVIRGIKAAVLAAETKGSRIALDEDGITAVIAKEVKEREDAIPEFSRGGRSDLVDKAQMEISVLRQYLPEPLDEASLAALITEAVAACQASGPRDMGKVMAWLTPKTRGRADGRVVSEAVKQRLNQG